MSKQTAAIEEISHLIDSKLEEIQLLIDAKLDEMALLTEAKKVLKSGSPTPRVKKKPRSKIKGSSSSTALLSTIELILGSSQRGMTSKELIVELGKRKALPSTSQEVYHAIYRLKNERKSVKTDKRQRHHALVAVSAQPLLTA